ncbi:rod shape-determining protein MreC [Jeongeupia sp. HS-3]|nr:rod shape-determining protein MreC [Jeongeupia sp. HS-3]BCL77361.1 rod shape-determining protein MreC [Jeongeupia sp. HS-3]
MIVGDAQYAMLGRIREQVSVLLYPLQWAATTPFATLRNTADFLSRQSELMSENRQLNDAQLAARAQAMKLKAVEAENATLRGLSERRSTVGQPSQLAEILYNGRDPFTSRLIVDRGQQQGVSAGQIAIDASGVVGQVVRVQPLTSEVRLISDRNQMVPVVVERNQLRTVVYGMGAHQSLEVRNMAPNVDIKPGDVLVTSGIDGLYPVGLPVARVLKVERGAAFARVICQPVAAVDQHRFLLLLDHRSDMPPYPEAASQPAATNRKGS